MNIVSSAFKPGGSIPQIYTCAGQNINPPLTITDIPPNTKTLSLIIDDPDAPDAIFTHWLIWNIPKDQTEIHEGSVPPNAVQGTNSFGDQKYTGPCPPEGQHRYLFKLYALDTALNLSGIAEKNQLEKQMQGHVLDKAEMVGIFAS